VYIRGKENMNNFGGKIFWKEVICKTGVDGRIILEQI
jgi:hypothetical protein